MGSDKTVVDGDNLNATKPKYYEGKGVDKKFVIGFITDVYERSNSYLWTEDHSLLKCGELIEGELKQFEILWCLHKLQTAWVSNNVYWIGSYQLYERPDGYAFEKREESTPPRHYNCPLEYLEKAPETNKQWRSKVYDYHVMMKTIDDVKDDKERDKLIHRLMLEETMRLSGD